MGRATEYLFLSDEAARGHGCGYRRNNHGIEVPDGEVSEDDFHGEQHAGDRSVEGGSDPGSGTGGNEAANLVLTKMCVPRER